MSEVKREPVEYRHDAINPLFLQFMALIGGYAGKKYGDPSQYRGARLKGEKGPVNHMRNHLGEFQRSEAHDHFGNDPRWHLAAIAYNAMIEFTYITDGHAPDVWPPAPANE